MHFLRGSHRWGFLNQGNFFATDREAQHDEINVPKGEKWEEVSALLSPGGVSFHDSLTFHGSGPNLSPKPRRSFAVHLCTDRSTCRPGTDVLFGFDLTDPKKSPIIYEKD